MPGGNGFEIVDAPPEFEVSDAPATPAIDLKGLAARTSQQAQQQILDRNNATMHGAIPFPTATPDATHAFEAQWKSPSNSITNFAGGYRPPEVPAGKEDEAALAVKLPQIAGAAAMGPALEGMAVPQIIGGVAGGYGGGIAAKAGAEKLRLSPEAKTMAENIGVQAGGMLGASGEGIPSRESIINTFRDSETGKLKPVIKTGARIAGYTAGGLAGKIGAPTGLSALGAVFGPSILDSIIPRLPEPMPEPEPVVETPELGTPENPGWVVKLPNRIPRVAAPTPELGSPENPGFHAKLPVTMPETTPDLGSPENPGFFSKLPNRMPSTKIPDRMPRAGSPENPNIKIVGPNDMAKPRVGSEGRPATWSNERVLQMAKQGNRVAITQAVRRGL